MGDGRREFVSSRHDAHWTGGIAVSGIEEGEGCGRPTKPLARIKCVMVFRKDVRITE